MQAIYGNMDRMLDWRRSLKAFDSSKPDERTDPQPEYNPPLVPLVSLILFMCPPPAVSATVVGAGCGGGDVGTSRDCKIVTVTLVGCECVCACGNGVDILLVLVVMGLMSYSYPPCFTRLCKRDSF